MSARAHAFSAYQPARDACERVWAIIPVKPLLHSGDKFLAFSPYGIYVFCSTAPAMGGHICREAYFFEDDASSPPLVEIRSCFRQTAFFRLEDLGRCALERDGFSSRVLVIETPGASSRFPLPRGANRTALRTVRVINGFSGRPAGTALRPVGISLLFLGLLGAASPGMSLFVSLPLVAAGSACLLYKGITAREPRASSPSQAQPGVPRNAFSAHRR